MVLCRRGRVTDGPGEEKRARTGRISLSVPQPRVYDKRGEKKCGRGQTFALPQAFESFIVRYYMPCALPHAAPGKRRRRDFNQRS